MKQFGFLHFDMRFSSINETDIPRVKLHNAMDWNRGFTLVELMITLAMVGILAAIAVPSYKDYIDRTKLVPCYNDIGILNLEYTLGIQIGSYSSATELKDYLLLEKFGYTYVSDGVYNCPDCDDDVYANVSLDDDDKLVISCSLDEATDSITAVLEAFDKAFDSLTGWPSGDALIAAYDGELAEVDTSLYDFDTIGTLYWKADTSGALRVEGENYILFATSDDDKSSHSQWKGYLAYYDGVYYKSTNENGLSSTVLDLATYTTVAEALAANNWVAI